MTRLDAAEERISEMEDKSEDNLQTEPWRDKMVDNIEEMENMRKSKIHVIRATEMQDSE